MQPTLEQLRARYGARYKWLVLLTVMLGTVASILSSTIVNVAVPALSRDFVLGQDRAQWVSAGFMLAMTLSMLTTPWFLLRFGLRRTYAGAIWLLLAGGVLGGFSVNYPMLLSMRIVEGLAAGVLQPIPSIVVLRAFESRLQGRAMGVYGFGVVLAPAIGPSVGGFLVEQFGWRSIFFVVVPFCMLVLLMIRRLLAINSPMMGSSRPLDWKGLLLAGVCTVTLLNGLVHLLHRPVQGLILLAVGAASLGIFVMYQLKAADGLMNLSLFRYPQFAAGALVAFIYGAGLYGSTYLLPVYLQMALRYAPSQAGLLLMPAGFVLAVTIMVAGRMSERIAPHLLVTFGLCLLSLSFLLMAFGPGASAYFALMGFAIVGRLGLGFVLPSLSLGAMQGVDRHLIAQGASTINFLRQLGGAIGVSLVGIVLEWRMDTEVPLADGAPASLTAFQQTFLFVALLCAAAVFAAWRMRPARHAGLD